MPVSNPFNDLLPKQALRAEDEEDERQHIGEPVLGRAAKEGGTDQELEQLLTHTDDQPADNRAGDRGDRGLGR